MDNTLRKWIASTLLHGYKIDQLQEVLVKSGFSPEEVEKELTLAAPYIATTHTLKRKLYARECLLKSLDAQMRALPHYLNAEKVKLPPYKEFLEKYYYPNQFGLFSSALDNCEARKWTPRNLVEKVGADTVVEMQYEYSNDASSRYEQNADKHSKQIKFGEFIDKVENTDSSNSFYIAAGNYQFNRTAFQELRKDIVDIGDGYFRPEDESHKMYCLIGPKGTVTAVHYDLVNNMLIQVYGRKRVRLIPAMQVPYLYNNVSTHSEVDLLNPKPALHPEFLKATIIDVELGPGDCLFTPAGWWHHVTALTSSISLICTQFNLPDEYNNIFKDGGYIFDHKPQRVSAKL